jgi:hypothetical protein
MSPLTFKTSNRSSGAGGFSYPAPEKKPSHMPSFFGSSF